jgi:glyoxylase-like metal-dependent hydrolase (beta-lactamase superfamily II)
MADRNNRRVPVAPGISLIDLEHLGRPGLIAAGVLETPEGLVIVDPGPASTLETLTAVMERDGLALNQVSVVLLTHVHLDHAGAAGSIVAANPAIKVYVHERGAPHLIDPSRLVQSATRLFGDNMDRLWGPMLPVPESNVHVVSDRDRLRFGSRILEAAYTPGHAVHHISYLDPETGTSFAGEAAGLRLWNTPFVYPPTPPPDVDLEAWSMSLQRLSAWDPDRLFIPHFGVSELIPEHLDACWRRLLLDRERVKQSLAVDTTDERRAQVFARTFSADLRAVLDPDDADKMETAANPNLCWYGLARYCRKQGC